MGYDGASCGALGGIGANLPTCPGSDAYLTYLVLVFIVKNNLHQNFFFGRLHLLNINGSTFASHTFRSSA